MCAVNACEERLKFLSENQIVANLRLNELTEFTDDVDPSTSVASSY